MAVFSTAGISNLFSKQPPPSREFLQLISTYLNLKEIPDNLQLKPESEKIEGSYFSLQGLPAIAAQLRYDGNKFYAKKEEEEDMFDVDSKEEEDMFDVD